MLKKFDFCGFTYLVSENGNIYGKNNKELKQRLNSDGYPVVTLGNKKVKRKVVSIHRIVCENFVDNPYNKPEVNHIDGNKQNNNYKNLEWSTRKEQIQHAFKIGLMTGKLGSANGRSILSEPDAIEIRKMYANNVPIAEIARKFGVGWTTVSHILKGETWKHC